MAWHAAGTYRAHDGRGGAGTGQQRFAPLNSWPDNGGLDKARRVLWQVKQKYGQSLSWGDLMVLAGNVALENMGFETLGYSGGREDVWEPENVYWGAESDWLGTDARYSGTNETTRELQKPFGATTMGLIYVNPEGPEGNPDPAAAAHDIRETFHRMNMDDEETIALIAGGHTFGKTHGAAPDSDENVGPDPEGAPLHRQGLGWENFHGTGKGDDQITSGLEVTWTYHPTRWDNEFFHILFAYEWEPVRGEGGHWHYRPKDNGGADMVPMAHSEGRREPRMLTTDISLRVDPAYEKISRKFKDDQAAFSDAFARAWFKLTHRDMGPKARYVGPEVPEQDFLWQDPLPQAQGETITDADVDAVKKRVLDSGLSTAQLVKTAWASISSYRGSDKRGGANGARIRLEPQRSWEANEPKELDRVLSALEDIQKEVNAEFSESGSGKHLSLADLIVLAGNAAIEQAAAAGGHTVAVPFTPGRVDASQEQTDVRLLRLPGAGVRRLPQLPARGPAGPGRAPPGRQGGTARADRPADDRAGRRTARPGCELRRLRRRCAHRPPGRAQQRLLRQPADPGQRVEPDRVRLLPLRRHRRRHRRGAVDRHPRRPGLLLELGAARPGRGLRQRRCVRDLGRRLRGRLGPGLRG